MLTWDLVRSQLRFEGKEVKPHYITKREGERFLSVADDLMALYSSFVGKGWGELEEAIEEYIGHSIDYPIIRGFSKLLEKYTILEPCFEIEPEALRERLFNVISPLRPIVRTPDLLFRNTRDEAMREASCSLGLPLEIIERDLYGDLKENHIIKSFDNPFTAETLIRRYNLALAQGILYRAVRMTMEVYDTFKTIFRYIKLARLMYDMERIPGGYRIILDGPLSLFKPVERYGINMALFLPALLLCKRWRMEAEVNIKEIGMMNFRLQDGCGLTSHYGMDKEFDSSIEEAFYKKFSKAETDWELLREAEVVDLKGSVFIPDFLLRHKSGVELALEIIGFWSPEYIKKKSEKIQKAKRGNLILAISENLNCGKDDFHGDVIRFKGRLLLKDILPVLDKYVSSAKTPGN